MKSLIALKGCKAMLVLTGCLPMTMLFGAQAVSWQIEVFPHYPGFLLAILPPGAFLVLGLLIAGKNYLDARASERAKAAHVPVEAAPSRRVRVTGVIE